MKSLTFAIGLVVLVLAPSKPILAQESGQEGFDNPTMGTAPCLVLTRYETGRGRLADGGQGHTATARFENVCGRSLEVSFCFLYMEPVEDRDRACYAGALRPWAASFAETPPAAARIAGPDYAWRYLPFDADGSMGATK